MKLIELFLNSVLLIMHIGTFSDVVVHVNGEELNAHKCILATQSIVFKRIIDRSMQYDNTADTSDRLTKVINRELQNGGDLIISEEELKENASNRTEVSDLTLKEIVPECIDIIRK